MNRNIDNYISSNYNELLKIAKKMTKQDPLSEDLLHECLLQIYNKGDIQLKSYDDNSIKYYIVAVMKINYFSKTSPFYYRIKRERVIMNEDIEQCYDIPTEIENYDREELLQLIESEYCELDFLRKSLMDLYLSLNSLAAVSRKTTIPLPSISRYINEGKNKIRINVINKLNN